MCVCVWGEWAWYRMILYFSRKFLTNKQTSSPCCMLVILEHLTDSTIKNLIFKQLLWSLSIKWQCINCLKAAYSVNSRWTHLGYASDYHLVWPENDSTQQVHLALCICHSLVFTTVISEQDLLLQNMNQCGNVFWVCHFWVILPRLMGWGSHIDKKCIGLYIHHCLRNSINRYVFANLP